MALAAGLSWSAPASAQSHPILDCAFEKASEPYKDKIYRAFKAAVLDNKELTLDRDEFLGMFANCGNFSKLDPEDQLRMGFAFIGVVLETRTEPRLRQGGIDVDALRKAMMPTLREFSIFDLLEENPEKSSTLSDKLAQSFVKFFNNKPEALFSKNEEALIVYSIGLIARQIVVGVD